MKTRNIALMVAAFVLTGLIAFAQMGGMGGQRQSGGMQGSPQPQQGGMTGSQQGGMMGSQQSQQMMTGQMMGRDMMRQMSTMMHQMNDMMQQMSHTMGNRNITDPSHMQDVSKIVGEMSATMNDMSVQMAKGKMEPADMQNLQGRMKNMSQMVQKLETIAKGQN